MHHNELHLKISDLLKNKITDQMSFSKIRISEFPDLSQEGISGKVLLQSLDQNSILVTLEEIRCEWEAVCDHCGTNFTRKIYVPTYYAKYVTELDPEGQDQEDEILLIDTKNETINLEEVLYHAIKLEEPFVLRCENCESYLPQEEDERY